MKNISKEEMIQILSDVDNLTTKKLEKIPSYVWEKFLKDTYNIECGGFDFYLPKDNGESFLCIDTYCECLHQTEVDVTKEEFKNVIKYIDQDVELVEFDKEDAIRYVVKHSPEYTCEWNDNTIKALVNISKISSFIKINKTYLDRLLDILP